MNQMTIADSVFSKYILKRDGHICKKCKGQATDNSHFYKRDYFSVRYEPLNCIALCRICHSYFELNPTMHKAWFQTIIGRDRFMELTNKAYTLLQIPKRELIEETIQKYKQYKQ